MGVIRFFFATLWAGTAGEPVTLQAMPSDIDGQQHSAAEPRARATVWVFIAHECPICNGYAPLLTRLAKEYANRNVRWVVVYAEPEMTDTAIREHARTYGLALPLVADPQLQIARQFAISTTPEVALVDERSRLAYRGRIDDLYAEPGVRRPTARSNDLRDAIEAVLAGRPAPHPRTTAVGCALEVPSGPAVAPAR